jgi:hypothetical protein
MDTIYTFEYLRSLFNEMAASYDRVNYLTSFGFSRRFRRQFIQKAGLQEGFTVVDLMCGRGECWPFILSVIGNGGKLLALDMSPGMLDGARRRLTRYSYGDITIIERNALSTGIYVVPKECGSDNWPVAARESGELPYAWRIHGTIPGVQTSRRSNACSGLRRRSGVVFSRMCDRSRRTKADLARSR